jgi:sugar O-acyltransferase (sialic acid O-acetyltransferase NeuD family)
MPRVVVFGLRDFASLAHFYLRHDSMHEVVAFTVDRAFLGDARELEGKPVVPFEEVEDSYPPADYRFFAPMSHRGMNKARESVFLKAKAKGYELISYVSSKATTFPGLEIGANCFILEDNTIQPYAKIGANVVLWSGNHIGHHSTIGDHAFFTSHVVLSGHCMVGDHAFIGVNATIRDGLTIGAGTLVAMGASIMRDTEEWSVYKGNPARKADVRSDEIDF